MGYGLQLKEMVLALLNESELDLSDDVVETIVDKVKTTCVYHAKRPNLIN